MRYFYYGNTTNGAKAGQDRQKQSQDKESSFQELVEEEDTVYEIDRACMECQKRIQKKKGNANSQEYFSTSPNRLRKTQDRT